MLHLAKTLATVFGAGFSPIAPGTVGSVIGCIIVYVISCFVDINVIILGGAIVLTYLIGIWSLSVLSDVWPHDDNRIVIDETLGIFVTLLFVPFSIKALIFGFIAFRFFDIVKPLGIRSIDKMDSQNAVLFDDVLAGIYANIILQIIFRWEILSF